MYNKYKELFDQYLGWLKKWYKSDDSIEYQKYLCITCNTYRDRLQGILELMRETGEISQSKRDEEWENVENTFSTKNLFALAIVHGAPYKFEEEGEEQINE